MPRPRNGEPTQLGAELTRLRGARSIKAVAELAGIPQATLSRIERGTHRPSVETARALAVWLGWTLEQVLDAAERPVSEVQPGSARSEVMIMFDDVLGEIRRAEAECKDSDGGRVVVYLQRLGKFIPVVDLKCGERGEALVTYSDQLVPVPLEPPYLVGGPHFWRQRGVMVPLPVGGATRVVGPGPA